MVIAYPDGLIVIGPELQWPDEEEDTRTRCRTVRLVGRFSLTADEVLDWAMSWFPPTRTRPRTRTPARLSGPPSSSGNTEVDTKLLKLPHTGYLACDDPRMLRSVERIEKDLATDEGFVFRYRTGAGIDGLEGGEYPFVMGTFWLFEQYAGRGRVNDASAMMATVLACAGGRAGTAA